VLKKMAAMMLALFLMVSGAAAEDLNGETVSVLAMNSAYATVDLSEAEIFHEIERRVNVKLEWHLIDPTVYGVSVARMLADGWENVPDVIQMPGLDLNMNYLSTGRVVRLDDYMEMMPNFSAFLEENPDIRAELTAVDGHIYYVPQTAVTRNYQPVLMVNQRWLEKAGMDAPETLDDMVELLRYFRDHDMNGDGRTDDEYPLSLMNEFLRRMFGPAFGLDLQSGYYADADNTVHYGPYEQDAYRAYLSFLHDLYEEGLLADDFITLTREQIVDRCEQDQTGVIFDFSWQMSNLYSAACEGYDGTEGIWTGIAPLDGECEGFYTGRNAISSIFAVNAESKHVETAVRFLDWAMGNEAQDLYVWGLEGLTYEKDENGKRHYLPRCTEDPEWFQSLGMNAPCLPSRQSVQATDILLPEWHVKNDREYEEPYIRMPFPNVYATEKEAAVMNMYEPAISTYVSEMAMAFICGYEDIETEFDGYIETLKSMQVEAVIETRQAQWDRYIRTMKAE